MKSAHRSASLAFALALLFPAQAFCAGAIAVDDERGETEPGYGFVTGKDSREEAARAALYECRRSGHSNCKVVVRFDECGAYAASKNFYGVGWGSSEKTARSKALDQCGHDTCRIVVSECE